MACCGCFEYPAGFLRNNGRIEKVTFHRAIGRSALNDPVVLVLLFFAASHSFTCSPEPLSVVAPRVQLNAQCIASTLYSDKLHPDQNCIGSTAFRSTASRSKSTAESTANRTTNCSSIVWSGAGRSLEHHS